MPKRLDIAGERFGRLLAKTSQGRNKRGTYDWLCECECGNLTVVQVAQLRNGNTKSCGCFAKEQVDKARTKHGYAHSKSYERWEAMIQRCTNSRCKEFSNYGGRGITVCEQWKNNPKDFCQWYEQEEEKLRDSGVREKLELERINNSLGYFPENCTLLPRAKNQLNRRTTKKVAFNGQVSPLRQIYADLEHRAECGYSVFSHRVLRLGWEIEKALAPRIRRSNR